MTTEDRHKCDGDNLPDCPCHQTYRDDCCIEEHRQHAGEYTPWAYLTPRERREQFTVVDGQQSERLPTVRDIGARGGRTTKERYGLEHYTAIGQKGGRTTRNRYGHEHFAALGRNVVGRTLAPDSGYLTMQRAAEQYDVSCHTLHWWHAKKHLPTYKFAGDRHRYVKGEEFERWLAEYRTAQRAQSAPDR